MCTISKGSIIDPVPSVKGLGVIADESLEFDSQFSYTFVNNEITFDIVIQRPELLLTILKIKVLPIIVYGIQWNTDI